MASSITHRPDKMALGPSEAFQPVIGPPMAVGAPTFSERLMRALELKGLLPNFIRPGFSPVVLAADLTEPQYRWLSRERMYFASGSAAAVPANNQTYALLFNPPGPDSLCIVDSIRLYNREATGQLWGIYLDNSTPPGGAFTARIQTLDGRADGPSAAVGPFQPWQAFPATFIFAGASVNAVPATAPLWEIGAGQALEIFGPWVLGRFPKPSPDLPPTRLIVHSQAVNVASSIIWRWRERAVQSSELG